METKHPSSCEPAAVSGSTTSGQAVVLINLSSSSATDIAGEITALFQRYGYGAPHILKGPGSEMPDLLQTMRRMEATIMVSYGGDGTAGAVSALARDRDCPFLPLPGGTMNMLTHGLYGSDDWKDCLLKGLAVDRARPMTAGRVIDASGEDHVFLVGSIFGQATRMSEAREELRDGNLLEAAKGALETLKTNDDQAPLYVSFGSDAAPTQPAELLNVFCPFMSGSALDPDRLDVMLVETLSAGTTLSLGLASLRGELQNDANVQAVQTDTFTLTSEAPIEALLDGEPRRFDGPVTVHIDKNCGRVLAPWPSLSFPKPEPAGSQAS